MMSENKKETLCWTCQNACGKCSWSRKFKKVKGWIAEKTIIKGEPNSLISEIPSYRVIKCPKYLQDKHSNFSTNFVKNSEVARWLKTPLRTYFRNTTRKEREENKQRYILEYVLKIHKRGAYEL